MKNGKSCKNNTKHIAHISVQNIVSTSFNLLDLLRYLLRLRLAERVKQNCRELKLKKT